ncbi:MAG: discoidin domain-containing protein, partial [Bacteroidaceae bacterium]|nr:discoidin domain-containing protein [Bacteroidaceae bacterium]
PHTGSAEVNHIPFTIEKAYPYIRFIVTNTVGASYSFRMFWHAAEIQFSTVKDNPSSRYIALGEIATNLEKILNENLAIDDADIEFKDYEKLLQAYELFKGGLIDPTELRDALKKYAKVTEGVVEGTEPGQWTSTDVAKAYDKLYAEAKAYEASGKYTVAQVHQYAAMLKAMSKSVAEQANGIKTGTWYRIMFPTEEMYDKYGFDKAPADKTGLREDQATMWGTFVATAYEVTEEEAAPTEEDPEAVANVTHLETYEKDAVSDASRLFFMADDEIEDKDLSKFRFIERPQEEVSYTGLFSEVMENSAVALDLSTTYTRGDALITDVKQLSSNASDEAEGKNLNDLIDGNPSTFWHSDWHQKVKQQPYLQVALNEPVSGLIQVGLVRRSNDFGHIVRMYVQGSNDAESWTNIGHFTTPYTSPGETVFSPAIDLGGSYSYLRFTITRRAGNDVEFDPFQVITSASPYDNDGGWTYFHSAEFQLYPITADKEPVATAKELQNTYNDLNKVVNVFKNPTAEQFATAKQAYSAYQREFNTSVGKAVLPNGAEKEASQYAIQNKANGMFIHSTDGNSNDLFLKLTPTFFRYSAPGYERSLLGGTNLNGSSTNNLHAGESNRRLCTWTSAEPYSNSALVIREAEAVEPADFEFNLSIKTGEIYNFTSTVSITNKSEEGVAYIGLGKYTDENDETYLALKKVEIIEAGAPAFYIVGDTTQYDAEEAPELVKFSMAAEPEFKLVGDTINGFVACMVNQPIGANDIIFDANFATSLGKTGMNLVAPGVLVNQALCPEVDATVEYDFAICLNDQDAVDGIKDVATAVKNVSKPGDVYSVDGKLLKTGATLNNLKSLGKGMYILNGMKVLVK